jgi:hypothetical protein
MRRRLRGLLNFVLAASVPAMIPGASPLASVATGAMPSRHTCTRLRSLGRTAHTVRDGNPLDVDVWRLRNVEARSAARHRCPVMEQTAYRSVPSRRRDDCHAAEATTRLGLLVKDSGNIVGLSAQDPRSATGGRLRRSATVEMHGVWQNSGEILMRGAARQWLPKRCRACRAPRA